MRASELRKLCASAAPSVDFVHSYVVTAANKWSHWLAFLCSHLSDLMGKKSFRKSSPVRWMAVNHRQTGKWAENGTAPFNDHLVWHMCSLLNVCAFFRNANLKTFFYFLSFLSLGISTKEKDKTIDASQYAAKCVQQQGESTQIKT